MAAPAGRIGLGRECRLVCGFRLGDAAAAPDLAGLSDDEHREQQRAFARTAHAITLRPVFSTPEFARLRTAWAPLGFGTRERQPVPTVRRA